MGFRDGDDSGEGGRVGVKRGGNPGRDGEGRDEGRTAMLRIGTKG